MKPPPVLLSTIGPPMVLKSVLVPVSVSVLLPAPLAVMPPVKVTAPAPFAVMASSVTPPVVPARSITRSLVLAAARLN